MSSDPKDPKAPPPPDTVREHEYDGIQEYDNRLPNWWLWTLYITIIFSFLYWFLFFETPSLKTDGERVEDAISRIEAARLAQVGELSDDILWEMSRNSGFVEAGRRIFVGEGACASCHGANLGGGIGVALNDDNWVWGNNPLSVYEIISEGSPNRASGMVAYRHLGPEKVKQLTAYILSFHTPESMAAASSQNPPIRVD